MNDAESLDVRIAAIPDVHGHAKGEHKPYLEERPIALSARMLFLWFYHACRRGSPRFLMVADHMNYLTFEDPAAVNLVRRALKLAAAGDLYGAAETANVDVAHAAIVSEGLRRGMRYSLGAEVDNDPRSRPDAQNIVDAMKPDGLIRSVHFLPIDHPVHGPNWNWPFDNPEFVEFFETVGTERVWELYMATLLDAIERLPGHIIGHFYVPAKFGHWPSDEVLEGHEDRFIAAVAERGMAIEFNTRFLYRSDDEEQRDRYKAANLRLMRKAKAAGVPIAVGSDAHSPKDQGGGFDQVIAILDEAEINELVFPIAGRLARVALRVIRTEEEEPAAPEGTGEQGPEEPATAERTTAGHGRAEQAAGEQRGAQPGAAEAAVTEAPGPQPAEAAEAAPAAAAGAAVATLETTPEESGRDVAVGDAGIPEESAALQAEAAAESPHAVAETAFGTSEQEETRQPARTATRRPTRPRRERTSKPSVRPSEGPGPAVKAASEEEAEYKPAPAATAAPRRKAAATEPRSAPRKKAAPARKSAASAKSSTARGRASATARTAGKAAGGTGGKRANSAATAKKTSAARRPAAKPAAKKTTAKKTAAPARSAARKSTAAKPPRGKASATKSGAKSAKKSAAKKSAVKKPAGKRRT